MDHLHDQLGIGIELLGGVAKNVSDYRVDVITALGGLRR